MSSSSNEFLYGKRTISEVLIESPGINTRKITASILINTPLETVWSILTDYNHLSEHVPNLVQSYLIPSPTNSLRLFQEGAQKIIGFDFRASLTMDMTEEKSDESRAMKERTLRFKLVESKMFSTFDGNWSVRYHSRSREFDPIVNAYKFTYKSMLTYSVVVRPKGPVPVMALEWRIKEDIPVNLLAVKVAAENKYKTDLFNSPNGKSARVDGDDDTNDNSSSSSSSSKGSSSSGGSKGTTPRNTMARRIDWMEDETLGSYLQQQPATMI